MGGMAGLHILLTLVTLAACVHPCALNWEVMSLIMVSIGRDFHHKYWVCSGLDCECSCCLYPMIGLVDCLMKYVHRVDSRKWQPF